MSTFSTKGGLYERAQKRIGVTDGKKLFTFSFFEKQRLEAMVGQPNTNQFKISCLSSFTLAWQPSISHSCSSCAAVQVFLAGVWYLSFRAGGKDAEQDVLYCPASPVGSCAGGLSDDSLC